MSGFGLDNLPYGVVDGRCVVRYGDHVVELSRVPGLPPVFDGPTLNPFLALGRPAWEETRARVSEVLAAGNAELLPLGEPQLPLAVGDFVDFYASLEHATNLGRRFRPDGDALLPNWRHLPIGYHGRAGSIVVSGTQIARPHGQRPDFGPTQALDIELELGFVTGPGAPLGTPIAAADAREHVFGFVLVNDWSARDLQRWEYQPLGPFLGKSFATSISPWIVPLQALEPYLVPARAQDPEPLPVPADRRRLGARRRARDRAQRRGDQPHERARAVLDVPADARPRDRQRRGGAARRPVRLGHDLGPRARERGLADRARAAVPGRRRHGRAARQRRHGVVRRGARDDRQRPMIAASAPGRPSGSNGLAITPAAPSARRRATSAA